MIGNPTSEPAATYAYVATHEVGSMFHWRSEYSRSPEPSALPDTVSETSEIDFTWAGSGPLDAFSVPGRVRMDWTALDSRTAVGRIRANPGTTIGLVGQLQVEPGHRPRAKSGVTLYCTTQKDPTYEIREDVQAIVAWVTPTDGELLFVASSIKNPNVSRKTAETKLREARRRWRPSTGEAE